MFKSLIKQNFTQLGQRAYTALQGLKHARKVDNLTDRYRFEDEMNAALDEINERGLRG